MTVEFRRYEDGDDEAVVTLNRWALEAAGTDPDDIPGTEDVHDVESAYLDAGGAFVVGVLPTEHVDERLPAGRRQQLSSGDSVVVAIGGVLPSEAGYADERTVAGAGELHRMRVAPPLQGRGYGRALLGVLEDRAREAGFDCLLATTARRQERAVALYRTAGYEEVGRSTHDEYDLLHFELAL